MRLCELRGKEVINAADGRCLGNVIDLDIDICCGHIQALIVPKTNKLFSLFCQEGEIVIPWCKVIKVGKDIILVEHTDEMAKSRKS